MILLSLTLFLSIILFILFETDALVQYIKFFKLEKAAPSFEEYNQIIESGGYVKYLEYLRKIDDRFLIQLGSCFICLSVWISLFFTLVSWNILNYPVINFGGLIGFLILKLLNKYSS